jgi:hypothetical protein
MISSLSIRHDARRWGASTFAIALAVHCSSAQAEKIKWIEVSGHVAPRCWAGLQPSLLMPALTLDSETAGAARCTQGTPLLTTRVLDVIVENGGPPDQSPFPHRAAIEIVVSPRV